MRIVVFGASGGVGAHVVAAALAQGQELWRRRDRGPRCRSGPDVRRTGMPYVVSAALEHGVGRLVSVSGAGVTLPGDAKGTGARFVSALTRRLARDLVQDKEGEHAVLSASGLSWTEVRPPRLVEREATGRWALVAQAPGLTAKPVPKADVALAMLELAGSQTWVRHSPFLVAG